MTVKVSVQEIYGSSEDDYEAFLAVLDESLNPRAPDMLYDKFGNLEPSADSLVLDIGSRYSAQSCELSKRFGCRVVGVELVDANIEEAKKHIAENRLEQSVQVIQGDIQHLSLPDKTFDFIWCRDVLTHIEDLHQLFKSCARVLKPNGKMLIFGMFATDLMPEEELRNFCIPIASVPENMREPYFEEAFTSAGFSLVEQDKLSSEWREYGEESGSNITSKQLLRIARLRRNREQIIAKFGEHNYASELVNCQWGVYQLLGKLGGIVYTISK